MATCELCEGTLEMVDAIDQAYREAGEWDGTRAGEPRRAPCPRCLSTPATPKLLDGWRGPVVDAKTGEEGVLRWTENTDTGWLASVCWDRGSIEPVALFRVRLDATRTEVRDRLARYLAHVLGLECGATAPGWIEADDMGTWEVGVTGGGGVQFATEADGMAYVVSTLATIPADAPPMLRAARALVLVTEEVSP